MKNYSKFNNLNEFICLIFFKTKLDIGHYEWLQEQQFKDIISLIPIYDKFNLMTKKKHPCFTNENADILTDNLKKFLF